MKVYLLILCIAITTLCSAQKKNFPYYFKPTSPEILRFKHKRNFIAGIDTLYSYDGEANRTVYCGYRLMPRNIFYYYYPSGNLYKIETYNSEFKKEGKTKIYYDKKKSIREKGKYADGEKNGSWKYFSKQGKLISEEIWEKGKLIKVKEKSLIVEKIKETKEKDSSRISKVGDTLVKDSAVVIVGTTGNAKLGAVIKTKDKEKNYTIYIDGLNSWKDNELNKKVEISGTLTIIYTGDPKIDEYPTVQTYLGTTFTRIKIETLKYIY